MTRDSRTPFLKATERNADALQLGGVARPASEAAASLFTDTDRILNYADTGFFVEFEMREFAERASEAAPDSVGHDSRGEPGSPRLTAIESGATRDIS